MASTPSKTVLVVEDSDAIREVMTSLFQEEGYAVLSTDRATDALALARRARPDAVMLDLALAGSDGRDVLRQLKRDPATAEIPVVVISALADSLRPGDRRIADDIIEKPFDLAVLLERLARLIGD